MAKQTDSSRTFSLTALQNPLGLSSDHLQRIAEDLLPLEGELAARAIGYVVDGAGPAVLFELRASATAGGALMLQFSLDPSRFQELQGIRALRSLVLRPAKPVAAAFYHRLGQVYGAAAYSTQRPSSCPTGWPDWFLMLFVELVLCRQYDARSSKLVRPWTWQKLAETLACDGISATVLVDTLLRDEQRKQLPPEVFYVSDGLYSLFSDTAAFLGQHLDRVKLALEQEPAKGLSSLLQLLRDQHVDVTLLLPTYVELAVQANHSVREELLPTLIQHATAAGALLQLVLLQGTSPHRCHAVELLFRMLGTGAVETLSKHLEQESNDRVQQTIRKLLPRPTGADTTAVDLTVVTVPMLPVETGVVILSTTVVDRLRVQFDKSYEKSCQVYERELQKYSSPTKPDWMRAPTKPEPVSAETFSRLIAYLEGRAERFYDNLHAQLAQFGALGDWFAPPDIKLVHVVRLAHAFGHLQVYTNHGGQRNEMHWHATQELEFYRQRCPEKFGLREVELALCTLPHVNPAVAGRAYLECNNGWHRFCDWEPEAIWPYFAERLELLEPYFGPPPNRDQRRTYDYAWGDRKKNAFRILAMLPQLPVKFVPQLWNLALGEAKSDRIPAQQALATIGGKLASIVLALEDGKQAVRGAAADWLGDLGDTAAIEPLKVALRKEKQEAVKGQLVRALDRLGADVHEFMDRQALLKEAEQGLKKKLPTGLQWFPLDTLPTMHWTDSGEVVNPQIVTWWIVQSVGRKLVASGPIVSRFLHMCRPLDVKAFARFVLTTWIAEDTRAMPYEEAAQRAAQEAARFWPQYGKHSYYVDLYKSEAGLSKALLQQYTGQCLGSAIGQKGLLSLVAAGGDRDCVKLCEQYIRKWFGQRLAQCKALLEVLAWNADPLAIQVLLSIANRFRTKSLRKAAEDYVQELADRQNWTIDQLADRTLPDGGFARETDEQGEPVGTRAQLILDYGPRKFVVTLDDELEPVITREDGKVVKTLPAPAKEDDDELAKIAKKAFADAKKTVKELVKRQAERLYEAVCTNRRWKFDEWQRDLLQHPIVGRLCSRLVWVAFESHINAAEAAVRIAFRPLNDGTLTDADDNAVSMTADMWIGVAHTCNLPAAVEAAWLQHLQDYDVVPLFTQFGRTVFTLPDEQQATSELETFQGHMLTTFRLRAKANKLGWVRGEAQDGGSFYWYSKSFPALQLTAMLEFSGSFLPESDLPCSLHMFYFVPQQKAGQQGGYRIQKLPLKQVPPVLLSEIYGDVQAIAAEGSGFDPHWESTGAW